ncbi:MAG: sugar kinase [Prevotella sp.]|nr:sugar kinase [Prevotella sp.]
MGKKIVTFGEVLLRWSKDDYQRLMQGRKFNGNYGGSEANVAVSLGMLGERVCYVSRVPQGGIGNACLNELRSWGIDVSHVVRGGDRLGTYYFEAAAGLRRSQVVYDRRGSSFYSSAPGMFDWAKIFSDADVFHCSGITCAVSQSATDATFEAVRTAKEMGLRVTCDINFRKNLWRYEGANAQKTLSELMGYSDYIFGDQDEWEVASGVPQVPMGHMMADTELDVDAYRRYFDKMHQLFPNCREMMLGLRNQLTTTHHVLTALLWYEGEMYVGHLYDIYPVLDPMGVGDAFVAGYIHASEQWSGNPRQCLDFSLAAAVLKNSVSGDFNLITEEEILNLLEGK